MSAPRIHIVQGEFATGRGSEIVISTLLGSCVSCCLWDPVEQIGGMNHMLLAVKNNESRASTLAGANAMELLINELIKQGAQRKRLLAKAFGGASMVAGLSDIGEANIEFTLSFLGAEGIEIVGQSLGGTQARNLRFWPGTGRVMQRTTDAPVREVEARFNAAQAPGNDVEMF